MEAGWERAHQFIRLEPAQVQAMLQPVGTVRSFAPLTTGLANTNYRVELEGHSQPVVLRLYTRQPEVCLTEVAVLERVRGRVPAPVVLHAACDAETPFLVTTWLEGLLLQDLLSVTTPAQQQQAGSAVGRTLADITAIRFDAPGFYTADGSLTPSGILPPFQDYVYSCLMNEGGADNLGLQLAEQVLQFLDAHTALLPGPETPPVLVHGDYKASNLLLRPVGDGYEVSGVLDWEFCYAGPALFDLAILLRYSDSMPEFEAGVLQGYLSNGASLPSDWKQRVRLLDFANLCSFVTGPNRAPQRIADVQRLLQQTLDRWQSYS